MIATSLACALLTIHRQPSQIIITNEKGHLSQAEIDRMTQRAEKCCAKASPQSQDWGQELFKNRAYYADTLNEEWL